ncbi:hypothetical protein E4T43_08406 [Aureobasidium subglaciale]|nr:hypothetical protein E4T43_08406 [Aureobasidium subglaciale]
MHSPHSSVSEDNSEDLGLLSVYEKEAGLHARERKPSIFGLLLPQLSSFSKASLLRPCDCPHYGRKLAFAALPSFVQSRIRPPMKSTKPLHPTGFLDGMRGIAAFLVIVFHLMICSYDTKHGFASTEAGGTGHENREWYKLPFIRIFYAGPTMVSIFFVVSGYALSYKPVKLMRAKNWQALSQSLASSIFRRAIRLFLPCLVSTFLISLMLWAGIYDGATEFAKASGQYNPKHAIEMPRFDSLAEQMSYFFSENFTKLINPWTFAAKMNEVHLDGHLWTIPFESVECISTLDSPTDICCRFRSSLILYLTQAGLSHLKTKIRIAILVCLIVWVHQIGRWEMILFYGGFLLAELGFQRSASPESILPTSDTATKRRSRKLKPVIYVCTFLLGMYLGGQPQKLAHRTPGWATLASVIPDNLGKIKRYWPGWGAIMLVWSTSCYKPLQRLFDNRLSQYLGRISFSLYIVHGAVTHVVGYPLMNVSDGLIGRDNGLNKAIGFYIGTLSTLFLTVWFADIFTRAVDEPSVRFARWVEEKCLTSE